MGKSKAKGIFCNEEMMPDSESYVLYVFLG